MWISTTGCKCHGPQRRLYYEFILFWGSSVIIKIIKTKPLRAHKFLKYKMNFGDYDAFWDIPKC